MSFIAQPHIFTRGLPDCDSTVAILLAEVANKIVCFASMSWLGRQLGFGNLGPEPTPRELKNVARSGFKVQERAKKEGWLESQEFARDHLPEGAGRTEGQREALRCHGGAVRRLAGDALRLVLEEKAAWERRVMVHEAKKAQKQALFDQKWEKEAKHRENEAARARRIREEQAAKATEKKERKAEQEPRIPTYHRAFRDEPLDKPVSAATVLGYVTALRGPPK